MFGYVRFSKGELKIKEYESYRAVYCSLCKKLGKDYGILSRFTLSYDFTFLSLLNLAMQDECPCFKSGRCTFNPLKKCNYCKNTDGLDMPAAAATVMFYYKLSDNAVDNKGLKKFGAKLLMLLFKRAHKKAALKYPQIEETVSLYIENQQKLESENENSLDKAADPTAIALSEILMLCSTDKTQKRVLERLGYCIGRFIYLLDAAADFTRDKQKNNYNVLTFDCKDEKEVENRVTPQLYNCINEAKAAFELLDLKRYKTILANVIYMGLEETFKKEIKNEQSV